MRVVQATGSLQAFASGTFVPVQTYTVPMGFVDTPAISMTTLQHGPALDHQGMVRYFTVATPSNESSQQEPMLIVPGFHEDASAGNDHAGGFLNTAGRFMKNLGGWIGDLALLPVSLFAMPATPMSMGEDGTTSPVERTMTGMSDRLYDRISKLADHSVYLSHGFYQNLLRGDFQTQFAEMLTLGLFTRISSGSTLSEELIGEVIGKIMERFSTEELISWKFSSELVMSERQLEDYFVVIEHDETKVIATREEPSTPAVTATPVQRAGDAEPEVVEAEFTDVAGTGETTPAAGKLILHSPEAGTALALPGMEQLQALKLPAQAIHSLARVSTDLAKHAISGLLQLELSTDTQHVADAIRVIKMLFSRASPEERRKLLRDLADIFLTYDEARQAESTESVRRIKREFFDTMRAIDMRESFVEDLETFLEGEEAQKINSIQGLAASLQDEQWDSDEFLTFAKYLVVRLILAEIKRGSSVKVLAAAMHSVHVIAPDIGTEGQVRAYISALMIRASAKDAYRDQSVVLDGLRGLLDADKASAISAMEAQFKANKFSPTDVLLYRLLVHNQDDPEAREILCENMVSDYTGVRGIEVSVKRALREAIVWAGEAALSPIVDEYESLLGANKLTAQQKEDLISLVDEIASGLDPAIEIPAKLTAFLQSQLEERRLFGIIANLKLLQRPNFSPEMKKTIYERAARRLFPDFQRNPLVLAGVDALEKVDGKEMLEFYRGKADGARGAEGKIFYVIRMAAVIGSMTRSYEYQDADISWALTQTLGLFVKYGREYFDAVCQLFSSPAVQPTKIRTAFDKIKTMPGDPNIPGRERRLLVAMAGNGALPRSYLINTVGGGLENIIEGLFTSSAGGSEGGTTLEERKFKDQTVSVLFNLECAGHPMLGDKVRDVFVKIAKDYPDKYKFDRSTDRLTLTGLMTDEEFASISALIGRPTKGETIVINEGALPSRLEARRDTLQELRRLAEGAAQEQRQTAASMGRQPTFTVGLDLAMKVSDQPSHEVFEEATNGLIRLYGNRALSRQERDEFLAKLMDLHDQTIRRAKSNPKEARNLDKWSFTVIRPLAGMFVSGSLTGSAQITHAFQFIVDNVVHGNLNASSRKAVLKLFERFLVRFQKTPRTISYFCSKLCSLIKTNQKEEWAAEREFFSAAITAFGKKGNLTPGSLDDKLERIMRALLN